MGLAPKNSTRVLHRNNLYNNYAFNKTSYGEKKLVVIDGIK